MNNSMLWILAVLLAMAGAWYTRTTGPTKPFRGAVTLDGEKISYKLIRTYALPTDAPAKIKVENTNIGGYFRYKRTPSHDQWQQAELVREGDQLIAYIPHQPPAGKVAYQVFLETGSQSIPLTAEPVVIRFRGDVPAWAMIPHILLMFAAMMLAIRAALAAFARHKTFSLSLWTLLTLVLGGLVFGPIVQKYAFGAYWTGYPFGTDLTDNKTAVAVLFWAYALMKVWKNNYHRGWVIAATVVLLMVFLIPHSMMGSEIDFTQEN